MHKHRMEAFNVIFKEREMKFYRVYIELTNVCGLQCSFCPTQQLPSQKMSLPFFEKVLEEVQPYTKEIACHVMGDPLTLPNLEDYLEKIHQKGLKALLTTSGYWVDRHCDETLFHPCVKQINISLNSFNKNDKSRSFEAYMEPIMALCQKNIAKGSPLFINLRLWNLDDRLSESAFNQKLFTYLGEVFNEPSLLEKAQEHHTRGSLRLAPKVLLHFDRYFEWPSLENPLYGDGFCHGLSSHIAILASGEVVPCCLDGEGVMALGSLQNSSLKEILETKRSVAIRQGFEEGRAVEELCLRCSYKKRFEK